MAQNPLGPPPPVKQDAVFDRWIRMVYQRIASAGQLLWSQLDFTGSNLTDLSTRNHADLQNINTANYTHLTATNHTDLTDGGDSALHYHASDRARANHTGTQAQTTVTVTTSGSPTVVTTSKDAYDLMWSAGSLSGFDLTDNGNGTVNIAAGEIVLRTSASETASIVSMSVSATTNLSLTDNSVNYIYVNYNAGTPVAQAGTSVNDFNCMDKCILYTAVREGTALSYADARNQNVDSNRKHRRMMLEAEGFRHVTGGSALSETGTRNIAVTAGAFYYGLAKISHSAFDTSVTDSFTYYYRNGSGGWTMVATQTQINNTQYDNGTGTLATLTNNKFGLHWIYLVNNTPSKLIIQYGQGDYNKISDALAATIPDAPPVANGLGVLIGRIVIEKSAAVFAAIESALATPFTSSTATTHNGLSGLQGGTTNEYYHLTSAQNTDLTDGGDSTFHYHATDRALSNATGTLALANGGTGVSLSDPNADRILFWDDSAGAFTWLTAGSGLTITDTTITASGSGGGSRSYAARH